MSSSSDFQLAQLDTELLIKEVKSRPSLYSRDDAKYNDVNYKKLLWEEVACALYANVWNNYNDEEKGEKFDLVQRRWKNLRACFTRELKRQKDPTWTYGVAYKRRKYLYYNELLFLKSELDNGEEDTTHEIDLPEKTEADNTTVTVDTNIEEIPIPEVMPMLKSKAENNDDKTPSTSTTNPVTNYTDIDSTNFALSLVPMLNMLPMHKRIDAQISILSVLKRLYRNNTSVKKRDSDEGVKKRRFDLRKTYGEKSNEDTVHSILIDKIKSEADSDDDNKEDLKCLYK